MRPLGLGGWALYAKDGTAKFVYNLLGMTEFITEATRPVPAGDHQIRMEFAYDGGGLGKGGKVTLYYDGDKVGEGRVQATQPMISPPTKPPTSAKTTGCQSPPTTAAPPANSTAKIDLVQIDLGDDSHDHLIDPAEVIRIAMSRQ